VPPTTFTMTGFGQGRREPQRAWDQLQSRLSSRRALVALGAILAVGIAGWRGYSDLWRFGDAHPLAWRDLTAKLGPLQFPRSAFKVFLRRDKLVAYLDAAMPGRAPDPPPIDFGHRKAVLIVDGPRSSTGYDFQVLRVTAQRTRVLVTVGERTPSLGDRVEARVTYPYRLITIPRLTRPTGLDFLDR
jgi:hypothetical protein